MKMLLPFMLLTTLTLGGCASTPILPLPRPLSGTAGEVVVFRESAFAAGGVGLTVGTGNNAFAVLGNAEKARARLASGEHVVFVRARSAEPSTVTVQVKPGTTICLRTSSSPGTYAKVLVPITLIATGYHFYLDEVPCPADAELARYKDVLVPYQE